MTTFIVTLVLLAAGVLAGLIQYYVDYKGLKFFEPGQQESQSFSDQGKPGLWKRLLRFFSDHWQFVGNIIVGIGGAFLVPVLAKLIRFEGIKVDFHCLGQPGCPSTGWDLLIVFGYGIISGYSSVRILRGLGSRMVELTGKAIQEQQQSIREQQQAIREQQQTIRDQQQSLTAIRNQVTNLNLQPAVQPSAKTAEKAALTAAAFAGQYFDEAENETDKETYYENIDVQADEVDFSALSQLLTDTHTRKLSYKPAVHLYPAVDLHPDDLLRSIYSGKPFTAEALQAMDETMDFLRENAMNNFNALEMSSTDFQETLEAQFPYNCEHVVPQSWFNKEQPMRGDLHHLFACEVRCNSFRSNHPYYDFPGFGSDTDVFEVIRDECGKREMVESPINDTRFEPEINKGVVARAVLYYLVRYPGSITGEGYTIDDVPMLINWHRSDRVSLYELHRNQFIYRAQGNRNPFIDHPEMADRIDFSPAFEQLQLAAAGVGSELPPPDDAAAATEPGITAGTMELQACPKTPDEVPFERWRSSESLKALLQKINSLAPNRRKASDGMIGDARHRARNSDHNPWVWDEATGKGVVTALDITHDPARRCDCSIIAQSIQNKKDTRIKYVIWNRRIMNSSSIGGAEPWTWRTYTGSNPHTKHMHISVKCEKQHYDSTAPWDVEAS